MNIFLEGLTSLEIDNGLFVNKKVLAKLACTQHECEDFQSEGADIDTSCNNCNKGLVHAPCAHGQIFVKKVQDATVRSAISN